MGLAGTDIGALRDHTDFTSDTPGSQAEAQVDIVGSLQVPADMTDAEVRPSPRAGSWRGATVSTRASRGAWLA